MATITKSASCPSEDVTFCFGPVTFSLTAASPSFVTTDQDVVASAKASEWLTVTEDVAAAAQEAHIDLNNPHDNPAADHLSLSASPAAIEAANANQAAIDKAVGSLENTATVADLSAAQSLAQTLTVMGVSSMSVPFPDTTATTTAPAPTTTTEPAPTTSSTSAPTTTSSSTEPAPTTTSSSTSGATS